MKQSYLHQQAIILLSEWVKENPSLIGLKQIERVAIEETFCTNGFIKFIPDISIYDNEGIKAMIEVVHKHDMNGVKLWVMQSYFYWHNISPLVITVDADKLMNLIEKPKYLLYLVFNKLEYNYDNHTNCF